MNAGNGYGHLEGHRGVVSGCGEWVWSVGWSLGLVSGYGQWMWSVTVVNEGLVSGCGQLGYRQLCGQSVCSANEGGCYKRVGELLGIELELESAGCAVRT